MQHWSQMKRIMSVHQTGHEFALLHSQKKKNIANLSISRTCMRFMIFLLFLMKLTAVEADKFMTSRNMIRDNVEYSGINSRTRRNVDEEEFKQEPVFRKKRSLPNEKDSKGVVDKHNFYRSTIGDEGEEPIPSNMKYMTWDASLAINSLLYARKCRFEHSTTEERLTDAFNDWNGENLWAGEGKFANNFHPDIGVEAWFLEYLDYEFDTHYCVPGKMCGHYTQMVWADSYKLGCAWVMCDSFDTMAGDIWTDAAYMVCHYAPGGNEDGTNLYKVGPRCSECESNDTCPDGRLCRNAERDKIIPGPTDIGHVVGIVLCILAIISLVSLLAYFLYSHKEELLGAWRKRRKIGNKADEKSGREENNNGTSNQSALPGIQQ